MGTPFWIATAIFSGISAFLGYVAGKPDGTLARKFIGMKQVLSLRLIQFALLLWAGIFGSFCFPVIVMLVCGSFGSILGGWVADATRPGPKKFKVRLGLTMDKAYVKVNKRISHGHDTIDTDIVDRPKLQ